MQLLLRKPDNYALEVGSWTSVGLFGRLLQLYFSQKPLLHSKVFPILQSQSRFIKQNSNDLLLLTLSAQLKKKKEPAITAAVTLSSLIAGHFLFRYQQTIYKKLDKRRLDIAQRKVISLSE